MRSVARNASAIMTRRAKQTRWSRQSISGQRAEGRRKTPSHSEHRRFHASGGALNTAGSIAHLARKPPAPLPAAQARSADGMNGIGKCMGQRLTATMRKGAKRFSKKQSLNVRAGLLRGNSRRTAARCEFGAHRPARRAKAGPPHCTSVRGQHGNELGVAAKRLRVGVGEVEERVHGTGSGRLSARGRLRLERKYVRRFGTVRQNRPCANAREPYQRRRSLVSNPNPLDPSYESQSPVFFAPVASPNRHGHDLRHPGGASSPS